MVTLDPFLHKILFDNTRLKTREVKVGGIGIGGNNPIRVQSMTTTDTMDTEATVKESIRIIQAGADLVRITAPSQKEAENLYHIKKKIRELGYVTPLVADIHYTPKAALIAAEIVEKVRINPGNYADKKKFVYKTYTEEDYKVELQRVQEVFKPLLDTCKIHNTALRIGVNHGSLSDRIVNRYGDSPKGMLMSALEFIQFCEDANFYDIILSMKSSNTRVMIQAYRLLLQHLMQNNQNIYPTHLGVTEAGDGMDGRIKSAVGIATLLLDGIGDTIRVSLTEKPENEIPVAEHIIHTIEKNRKNTSVASFENIGLKPSFSPFSYNRRHTINMLNIGSTNVPIVVGTLLKTRIEPSHLFAFGYTYSKTLDKWSINDMAVDMLYTHTEIISFPLPSTLNILCEYETWRKHKPKRHYPLVTIDAINVDNIELSDEINVLQTDLLDLCNIESIEILQQLKSYNITLCIVLDMDYSILSFRKCIALLEKKGISFPIIVHIKAEENTFLDVSTLFGNMLLDGLLDGLWLSSTVMDNQNIVQTTFSLLQATKSRISKTEYISCPSCGRTLFDLEEVTAKVREKTSHLKGLKIAIMGCIVNGPGEMADADYGYVGSGKGLISLYKKQTLVKKNIPQDIAVTTLIELIRSNGDWVKQNSLNGV